MGAEAKTAKPRVVTPNRVYSSRQEFAQDCFKLEIANMKRNETAFYNDTKGVKRLPQVIEIEHVHFYYTTDRKGNSQTRCVATGGHKHEVKTRMDENGDLVGVCSGPIAHGGAVYQHDHHTHEVSYLKSAKVSATLRKERAKEIMEYSENVLPTN